MLAFTQPISSNSSWQKCYSRDLGDGPRNLDHGQVTRTSPELVPPSSNFHTTPTRGRLSLEKFNVHCLSTWQVFSGTRLELMTRRPLVRSLGYSDHQCRFIHWALGTDAWWPGAWISWT
ncbi:hypothetical protein TNCV_5124981 [Trichonephila clavipes]|nr:hypothetical protein TNCV_5124981 [Trichonephila clavipes]